MKNCKKCGFCNDDANLFCANCGNKFEENIPTKAENESTTDTKTSQEPTTNKTQTNKPNEQQKMKKIAAVVFVAIILISLLSLCLTMCTNSGSATSKNVKKYVYRGEGAGNGSYFIINFDTEEYEYNGTYVNPKTGFFGSGTLNSSGIFFYKRTIDGIKQYYFHDNPWGKTSSYVSIDEEKKCLIVFAYFGHYVFQEE